MAGKQTSVLRAPTGGHPIADAKRRRLLIARMSVAVGAITLVLGVLRALTEGAGALRAVVLFVLGAVLLTMPLLVRRLPLDVCGAIVPAGALVALVTMATSEAGLHSEAVFWIPFVPLVAALLTSSRHAVVFGGLALLSLALIAVVHTQGVADPAFDEGTWRMLKLASALGTTVFAATIAWQYEATRLRAEHEIVSTHARGGALLSELPDLILRVKETLIVDDVSVPEPAPEWWGSFDDAAPLASLVPGPVAVLVDELVQDERRTGEVEFSHGDKNHVVEVRVRPIDAGHTLVILRDITATREAEIAKADFVSVVSHELRTPLTAMRGSLALVASGALGDLPPRARGVMDIATRNADRLADLIDDILDIQKSEAGGLQQRLKPVDAAELVTSAVETNQAFADKYDVALEHPDDLYPATVYADRGRLDQVLSNFISNAVKYSPTGGVVRVWEERHGERIRFCVHDDGPGIPAEFRDRVFEKFAQADSSATRAVGGTGLGLSICKAIIDELGGTIAFDTGGHDGTTFWFELDELVDEQ